MDQLLWADFRRSAEDYRALVAALGDCRDELGRTERRIELIAALLAVDGIGVELPSKLDADIRARLSARLRLEGR